MKLTDLDPKWIVVGGYTGGDGRVHPRRTGVGVSFDCPCGCDERVRVLFTNPLDGEPTVEPKGWERTGDTFEALTITPSIARIDDCRWHGFITNGEVRTI